jgi:hypothetical protein
VIEVIGILILLVLFTAAIVNIIAPASDWKSLREAENDLGEDNVSAEEYFWEKMNEMFWLLEVDPPERGTMWASCTPYVEKAIEQIWSLRNRANLSAPGYRWVRIDGKWEKEQLKTI